MTQKNLAAGSSAADIEMRLLGMVRDLSVELRVGASDIDRLGLDHQLERDFGMDSLARVELLARIQREFNVQLTEEVFATAETPRDLVVQVKTGLAVSICHL